MIPLLFFAGLALFQAVSMGPMAIEEGQILHLASRSTVTQEESFAELARQRVVLVGESHDDPGHHLVQLQIIKALKSRNNRLAIGLEMFPSHLQPQLDRWVAAEMDENTFLDAVEWYSTWGFAAELYMPILRFARDKQIPLVAMNIDRDIVHQVRMQGVDGVAETTRRQLPTMAPASVAYRARLQKVFDSHPMMSRMGNFDRFVEAQLVWDGVMAVRIFDWLRENPDGLLVGLAGSGHIIHGHGIPHQLRSLEVRNIATVLPWTTGDEMLEPQSADYVWGVAKPELGPPPVRFGIFLEDKGAVVHIIKVVDDSLAAKAGLLAEDQIIQLNGQTISSRHMLVRLTRSLDWGDMATLTIVRAGEEKSFAIELVQEPGGED
jgi:uncharacterized iron-regulated protein